MTGIVTETPLSARAAPAPRARLGALRSRAREHGYLLSGIVWLLVVLNFNALAFTEPDEYVQFGIVKHLFGDGPDASGYFFGLAVLEIPLYALGDLLSALGLSITGPAGSVDPNTTHQFVVAFGFGLLTVAMWPLLHPVFRGLRLPRAGTSLLLAALGTPFLFYATIQPAKTHTVEALLFAIVVLLLYRSLTAESPAAWWALAIGVTIGVATTVRYPNGAQGPALMLCFIVLGRWREAVRVAVGASVAALAIMAWPLAHHERFGVTEYRGGRFVPPLDTGYIRLDLTAPFDMLFGTYRGLFLWSPVAAAGVVGLVLLWRNRGPVERRFIATASVTGFSVLVTYVLQPWGTTGWSFSNRFLTPLLPLFAIGLAGFLQYVAWRRLAAGAVLACVTWALILYVSALGFGGRLIYLKNPYVLATWARRTDSSWHIYPWAVEQHSNVAFWARY